MLKQHTICYIEEKKQPKDFYECTNCYLNKHTCDLNYEKFEQTIKFDFKYNSKYTTLQNICECNRCKKCEYCDFFKNIAFKKIEEIEKINCRVCRIENKLYPPLDTFCKCKNKKELYFYKISRYDEIDMSKNECYIIDVYKREDFLAEKEKLSCDVKNTTLFIRALFALEKNANKICSFTICDTIDDSDTILKELLEKYKTMFDDDIIVIDNFYFRKFQNMYNKIINKKIVNFTSKPNTHLTQKKKQIK
jgi:hypothetical protein